jgi:hypothetical protein
VGFIVEVEAYAPVADTQSPFVVTSELLYVSGVGIPNETVEGVDHALADGRI